MHDLGTVPLATSRLRLRRFNLDDAGAMFANWSSDVQVAEFLTWPPHTDIGMTRSYLARVIAGYDDAQRYDWGIELADSRQLIGGISVVGHDDAVSAKEIGYCIGRPWWHRGFMSEALAAVIGFLFDRVGANRIEAYHDPHNPRSGRVMAACGMRYEGTRRSASRSNRGIVDVSGYGLLAGDPRT